MKKLLSVCYLLFALIFAISLQAGPHDGQPGNGNHGGGRPDGHGDRSWNRHGGYYPGRGHFYRGPIVTSRVYYYNPAPVVVYAPPPATVIVPPQPTIVVPSEPVIIAQPPVIVEQPPVIIATPSPTVIVSPIPQVIISLPLFPIAISHHR